MKKQEASKMPDHDRKQGTGNGGNGDGGSRQKRRQFTDDQIRSRRIINPNMRDDCKLSQNEQFNDVFHPGNIRTLVKPKYTNGVEMCIRYHDLGFCFGDCKHEKGLGVMDNEECVKFRQFVATARSNHADFRQRRGSNSRNQDRNADRPTTGTPPAANAGPGNQGP